MVIQTKHGPIEFAEQGEGVPLLYFHGTGVSCHGMLPFESPLAEAGFRLIMPNRPGYGRTPLENHGKASDCAKLAAALLDSLQVDSACIMGSSGGAAFATSFAANFPQRTRCLTLMCPQLHRWTAKQWLPKGSRWTWPFLRTSWTRKLLLKLYALQLPRMSVDQYLKMEAGDRYPSISDDENARDLARRSLAAMAKGPQQPGFENDFQVFLTEDVLAESDDIKAPVLILHDELDPIATVDHVDWFCSLVAHTERVSLQTAGHLVWTGPEASRMHDARLRFLRQHGGGKP